MSEIDRRDVRKVDGDTTTVEELCELMEETGGYFDGDRFSVITEGGRNTRQHGRTSISPSSFPSTQIDKGKIKREILSYRDAFIANVIDSFPDTENKLIASIAIDQAINLAIAFTLREAEIEKQILRQKLMEDLKHYEKENIDTVRQSRLFTFMLNDIVEIVNKRFEGDNAH